MAKYKITVSKNQKKYTIVYEAETEKIARDRVHKEGYSILSVEKFEDDSISGKEYIFEIKHKNDIKKGKVIGSDLFKVYLKLKDGLGYDEKKLYIKSDENLEEKQKEDLIKNLEDQYRIYKKLEKTKTNKTKEKTSQIEDFSADLNLDNFYLKKELEETYKLIDFILNKLKNLIEKDSIDASVSVEKRIKLKNIYNTIIKIRNSSNISKLKQIGEKALLKIGEIELKELETHKSKKSETLLKQTNKTLKQIGSEKQFVEKDKNLNYILSSIKQKLTDFTDSFKQIKEEKPEIIYKDKGSYSYLKTVSLLNKYKKKLSENTLEIIKNAKVFILPFGSSSEKKDDLIIKRSVIKQNIALLKAKNDGKVFSYTKTIKGYSVILDYIFGLFVTLRTYILYTAIFYSIIFIVLLNLNHYNIFLGASETLNFSGIFYFLVLLFTYFTIFFSRGMFSLIFNFVILFFIIIFGVVNF